MIRYLKLVIILIFFQFSHLISIYKGRTVTVMENYLELFFQPFKSLPRICGKQVCWNIVTSEFPSSSWGT